MSHTAHGTTTTSVTVKVFYFREKKTINEHEPAVLCSDGFVRPYDILAFPPHAKVTPIAFAGIFAQTTILRSASPTVLAIYTSGVASINLRTSQPQRTNPAKWTRYANFKMKVTLGLVEHFQGFILDRKDRMHAAGIAAGTIVGFNGNYTMPLIKFNAGAPDGHTVLATRAETLEFDDKAHYTQWRTLVAPLHATNVYINAKAKKNNVINSIKPLSMVTQVQFIEVADLEDDGTWKNATKASITFPEDKRSSYTAVAFLQPDYIWQMAAFSTDPTCVIPKYGPNASSDPVRRTIDQLHHVFKKSAGTLTLTDSTTTKQSVFQITALTTPNELQELLKGVEPYTLYTYTFE